MTSEEAIIADEAAENRAWDAATAAGLTERRELKSSYGTNAWETDKKMLERLFRSGFRSGRRGDP